MNALTDFIFLLSVPFIITWAVRSFRKKQAPWLIMDIKGTTLSKQEQQMLTHPEIFGVVLTQAKVYGDPSQGGVRYQGIDTMKLLASEIKLIRRDLKICIDHEGGEIVRFTDPNIARTPYLSDYLAKHPESLRTCAAKQYGKRVGEILQMACVDILLGPVVDLGSRYSQIESRTLSYDPNTATEYAHAFIESIQLFGIHPVLKHFPGLDHAGADTHLKTCTQHSIKNFNRGLKPFMALKDCIPSVSVMLGHAKYPLDPDYPATMSTKFKALAAPFARTFTDDISMGALDEYGPLNKRLLKAKSLGHITICMHQQDKLYEFLFQTAPVESNIGLSTH